MCTCTYKYICTHTYNLIIRIENLLMRHNDEVNTLHNKLRLYLVCTYEYVNKYIHVYNVYVIYFSVCVCIMCGALSMCKQKSYGGLWPLSVCPPVQPSMLELVSALASADDCHQLLRTVPRYQA